MADLIRALVLLSLTGCLTTSPERLAEDELGNTDHCVAEPGEGERECGSPFHRPGQPCLVCHDGLQGPQMAVAGTVYRRANDTVGLGGVDVTIVDALGQSVTVPTNAAGNFYVRDQRGRLDIDREDGEAKVPFRFEYPLTVELSYEGTTQEMRSTIWREGSCSGCHTAEEGPGSPGRIFVEELP